MKDLFKGELGQEFQRALSDQARKQWLAGIDERIAQYNKHMRRTEGQLGRYIMMDIRMKKWTALRQFELQLTDLMNAIHSIR